MKLNKTAILVNVIAVVFLCILCIALYKEYQGNDLCSQRGGVMVKTHNGYVCAKIEEIK